MDSELPSHTRAAVQALLKEDKLIQAIKLYREYTNAGLKEAKEAVEFMRDNPDRFGDSGPAPSPAAETDRFGPDPSIFEPGIDTGGNMDEVVEHIKAGRKIHAIKAYRMMTNDGLREAKEAVEKMARGILAGDPDRRREFDRSGGGAVVYFFLIGLAILLAILIMLGS